MNDDPDRADTPDGQRQSRRDVTTVSAVYRSNDAGDDASGDRGNTDENGSFRDRAGFNWGEMFPDDVTCALQLIDPYIEAFTESDKPLIQITFNGQTRFVDAASPRLFAIIAKLFERYMGRRLTKSVRSAVELALRDRAFLAPERTLALRTIEIENTVFIDLGDGLVARIDATGYEVTRTTKVHFRQAAALTRPAGPADVMLLRQHLNVSDHQFQLIVAWLTFSLLPNGPYPILGLFGEHGSAKSTASKILRRLVDGKLLPGRTIPTNKRDLDVAAKHSHVLAYDNVSLISATASDWLARYSTGDEDGRRANYTNDDEVTFEARRPVMITGIENVITRADLADRSIIVELSPLPFSNKIPEKEILSRFAEDEPQIVAGLFSLITDGLRRRQCYASGLPRMADFALWGMAVEATYWSPGSFMLNYLENIAEGSRNAVDDDEVGVALLALVGAAEEASWSGTASELMTWITQFYSRGGTAQGGLPRTARSLSERLNRLKPNLRRQGITISHMRAGRQSQKLILICRGSNRST